VHRRLDKNVEQLPLLCLRVDFLAIATLDAKDNLEGVIDGYVTLFVPVSEINEGAVSRKLKFMVKRPWPWTHDGCGHLILVLISI